MHEENKDVTSQVVSMVAMFVGAIGGLLVLVAAFTKGFAWVANNIYLPLLDVSMALVAVLILAGIVVAVWKRSGVLLIVASYVWVFVFWIWCLLAAFATLGVWGVVVGVVLVGIGAVPVAAAGMLFNGWWLFLGMLVLNVIAICALHIVGVAISERNS